MFERSTGVKPSEKYGTLGNLFLLREFRVLAPWDRVPHPHEHASANL